MDNYRAHLARHRKLARKYKEMNLPVQRRNEIESALFWRLLIRSNG